MVLGYKCSIAKAAYPALDGRQRVSYHLPIFESCKCASMNLRCNHRSVKTISPEHNRSLFGSTTANRCSSHVDEKSGSSTWPLQCRASRHCLDVRLNGGQFDGQSNTIASKSTHHCSFAGIVEFAEPPRILWNAAISVAATVQGPPWTTMIYVS